MSELRHFVIAKHMKLILDIMVRTFKLEANFATLSVDHMIYLENIIDHELGADVSWKYPNFINCSQKLL